jgi:hypothetical protein
VDQFSGSGHAHWAARQSRKERAQMIQRLLACDRTRRPASSCKMPRLPIQLPRNGVATICPVGVTRFGRGLMAATVSGILMRRAGAAGTGPLAQLAELRTFNP